MRIVSLLITILFACSYLFIIPAPAKTLLDCSKPGHCFQVGEAVQFNLVFSDLTKTDSGRLKVLDYDNQPILDLKWNSGETPTGNRSGWSVAVQSNQIELIWQKPKQGFYIVQYFPAGQIEPASYLRFVVIPRRDYFGPSPFAMDAAFSWFVSDENDLREACGLLKAAGVDWVRDRISWAQVQPARDRWDWKRYDTPNRVQHGCGLNVFQIFHDTAPWASRAVPGTPEPRRYPPANLNDLATFLSTAASRYRDTVQAWEIWNEMDSTTFFAGQAEEYAPLLKKSYQAIKRGNPDTNVLLGSICFFEGTHVAGDHVYEDREGPRFLEKILECGAGDYFDTYNFHHYGSPDALVERYAIDRAILERFNLADKPVWLTEMGMPGLGPTTADLQEFEKKQADYLVKTYTIATSLGVEKVFYFFFPSFLEFGRSYWGIYDYLPGGEWSPKPAYSALAQLTHLLREGNCLGRLEWGEGVRGIWFKVQNQDVLVVWCTRPQERQLEIPTTEFEVRDVLGRSVALASERMVSISESPVYIIGQLEPVIDKKSLITPPRAKSRHRKSRREPLTVSFRCDPPCVAQGDEVTYDLQIYNDSKKVQKGELSYEMIGPISSSWPNSFSIPAGEVYEASFSQIWQESKQGELVQSVKVLQRNKVVGMGKTYLTAVTAVKLLTARLEPSDSATGFALSIKLENQSAQNRQVKLKLSQQSQPNRVFESLLGSVEPGEKRNFSLQLPDWFSLGGLVSISINEDCRKMMLDIPVVASLNRTPVIDGKPDWDGLSQWHLFRHQQCVQGGRIWNGTQDLSGRVCAALVDDNLYLAGMVTDNESNPPRGVEEPWTGDAIEVFLDFRTEKRGSPEYGPGVYQLFIQLPSVLLPQGRAALWQPQIRELEQAQFVFIRQERRYSFEALIPLSDLGEQSVEPGRVIGMDVVLDDRDGYGGRHKQMAWQGTSENWRDASTFAPVRVTAER